MKVIIINGPNLNLLGVREKSIYGDISFQDYFINLQEEFPNLNLEQFQSNVEGELINKLQEIEGRLWGIKGQYLMFDDGKVLNIRKHNGYKVSLEI